MIVAGVMSGTSGDGADVALVDLSSRGRAKMPILMRLIGHYHVPYPERIRRAVLECMNAQSARVSDLARLNVLLGEIYAEAVDRAQRKFRVKAVLVGCHGQTLYHQGDPAVFLGRKLACTWQTGEGAVLAAKLGVPVVSDFRPADIAAGGKGAPLVPFFDYAFYRDSRIGRIAQNIGGIANATAIPARAGLEDVIAFDTGPGNMVIDALCEQLFHIPYDDEGRIAASGRVLEEVVTRALGAPFFRKKPPKTAGREEFGREFVRRFLETCGKADKRDVVATATALTARSIAESLRRFVLTRTGYRELVASGGGTRNATLMAMLANATAPLGLRLRSSDEFGLPSEAKEAVAFAMLAHQSWHRRPGNVASATGAKRPVVLGKISFP
jgi:anhydro-N-acetylmuramic acid kinase